MWHGNIPALRGEYLFELASVCHCPPPVVGSLRLSDFARLIAGIDEMRRAS